MSPSPTPAIDLHYLGHAAFLLTFANGLTLLTDYGQSRAYGLDSPIYDLSGCQPDIVTCSHHHADHDRGPLFAEARQLAGESLSLKGLTLTAVPVSENSLDDNYGYLITYEGLTLFHAGDCQGDMVSLEQAEVRQRLHSRLPARLDLLLAPIGWRRDILAPAEAYIAFLQPRRVIPMHYWAEADKVSFLAYLATTGRPYHVTEPGGPCYALPAPAAETGVEVINLSPAPCEG